MDKNPYGEATVVQLVAQLPRILWNRKVHYRIYRSSPLAPVFAAD